MDHAVIPAPARFEAGAVAGRGFAFRPGTVVAYADTPIAPAVARFCAQIARRTGLRISPARAGDPAPDEPSVRIELAAAGELDELPAPAGLSPAGDHAADERYSLVIGAGQVTVRAQTERQSRAGLRLYAPKTVAESFGWEPAEALGPGRAAQVAGVEAAIWAETISGFDDLTFLLLPRLAGVAHRAWSAPQPGGWPAHRDRLARHGRLWAQDGLTYFRASTVDWA